jgi:hypothetical protein
MAIGPGNGFFLYWGTRVERRSYAPSHTLETAMTTCMPMVQYDVTMTKTPRTRDDDRAEMRTSRYSRACSKVDRPMKGTLASTRLPPASIGTSSDSCSFNTSAVPRDMKVRGEKKREVCEGRPWYRRHHCRHYDQSSVGGRARVSSG